METQEEHIHKHIQAHRQTETESQRTQTLFWSLDIPQCVGVAVAHDTLETVQIHRREQMMFDFQH